MGRAVGSPVKALEGMVLLDESRNTANQYYSLSPTMKQVVQTFGPTGRKDLKEVETIKRNYPVESNPSVLAAYRSAEKKLDDIRDRKKKATSESSLDRLKAQEAEAQAAFLRTYNRVYSRQ